MSHKQSKKIRAAVKAQGLHPRAIVLKPAKPITVGVMPPLQPGAIFLGQREIQPHCGRGMVRAVKKAVRNGAAVPA